MNTPRTRLSPGHRWPDSRLSFAITQPSTLPPEATRPRPLPPPAGMPGVEVHELDSDTVFDRHFGQQDEDPDLGLDQLLRR